MTIGGAAIFRWRRGERVWPRLVLASVLLAVWPVSANAQLFSDHPPPVPPASVPDAGPAVSLAPPSGRGSGPPPGLSGPASLPPVLTQPSIGTVAPAAPPG